MSKADKLKIAVGTKSKQKLDYLQSVIDEIGIKAEIIPIDAKSNVSDQPSSEGEVLEGSIKRANNALLKLKNANIGLGIEVGYHKEQSGYYTMFGCASIVDRNNFTQSCYSSRFPLPKYHQNILESKKYLGDYVKEYKKNSDDPVSNYIRELIRGRKPLIIEATRNTLLTYLEKLDNEN